MRRRLAKQPMSESSVRPTPLDDILLGCGLKALGENPPLDAVEIGLRALAQAMSGEDRGRKRLLVEGAIGLLKKAKVSGRSLSTPMRHLATDN